MPAHGRSAAPSTHPDWPTSGVQLPWNMGRPCSSRGHAQAQGHSALSAPPPPARASSPSVIRAVEGRRLCQWLARRARLCARGCAAAERCCCHCAAAPALSMCPQVLSRMRQLHTWQRRPQPFRALPAPLPCQAPRQRAASWRRQLSARQTQLLGGTQRQSRAGEARHTRPPAPPVSGSAAHGVLASDHACHARACLAMPGKSANMAAHGALASDHAWPQLLPQMHAHLWLSFATLAHFYKHCKPKGDKRRQSKAPTCSLRFATACPPLAPHRAHLRRHTTACCTRQQPLKSRHLPKCQEATDVWDLHSRARVDPHVSCFQLRRVAKH
eukprot:246807-Chlamydomonas_euryale.AAC.5